MGDIELKLGVETVMLVANTSFTVKLIQPVAMEGLRFAIREGGRTVGAKSLQLNGLRE